jgi:hypothetical protein
LEKLEQESKELASDIVKRYQQIDTLIESLPKFNHDEQEEASKWSLNDSLTHFNIGRNISSTWNGKPTCW